MMDEKINNIMPGKDTIHTDFMVIRQNIMEWGNTMIQLSNVCSVFAQTFVKDRPFPVGGLLIGVLGLVVLFFNALLGILCLAIAVCWIYWWKAKKKNPEKIITLNITMNSGARFRFAFEDEEFKERVLKVLETIISRGNSLNIGDINIDIKNNNIQGDLDFMNGGW